MHYHAEIWVACLDDVEDQIDRVMAPHHEEYNEATDLSGFWDWYQVGGRWTGVHMPDYDPCQDPRNVKVCDLCNGTGFRRDLVGEERRAEQPEYTCNGCGEFDSITKLWRHGAHGPGKTVKWATQWAPFGGDVMPVNDVRDDLECYTLVIGRRVFHRRKWDGEEFVDTEFNGNVRELLQKLGVVKGHLVTVDYHC